MKRSILAMTALILAALTASPGVVDFAARAAQRAPAIAADAAGTAKPGDRVAGPRMAAAAPDRGVQRRDDGSIGDDADRPKASEPKADGPNDDGRVTAVPRGQEVLPRRSPVAGLIELAGLIVAGFAIGLAGLALGRTGGGVALAVLGGGAIGSALYSFLMGAPVSHPSGAVSAALLIFCASALATNMLGRAGLAAVRRMLAGRRAAATGEPAE